VSADFYGYQGFFMKFLELVKEQEEQGSSISSFLEFFDTAPDEDLYVNVTEDNAVKIFTIHKSKGLEFPAVIIPFLEMNVKIDSRLVVPDGNELRLMYIKKKYCDFSPFLRELSKKEYLKACIDELNSIYVAFTRAAHELYIFVSPKAQRGFNPASVLLPENNLQRGEKAAYTRNGKRKEPPAIEIPASKYKDWIHLVKEEFIDEGLLWAPENIARGETLHYILSFIGNLYNQAKVMAVKEAVDKARVRLAAIGDFTGFAYTISGLLHNARCAPYFETEKGDVYQEKEIVDSFGNTKRIDRLIVTQKEVVVIDYKSVKDEKSDYREQLLGYMRSIKDMYPACGVKGVLMYLDDFSLEEVNDTVLAAR
jgi:ATP-dependent exoDNAse (exonuclease V) beta subunit